MLIAHCWSRALKCQALVRLHRRHPATGNMLSYGITLEQFVFLLQPQLDLTFVIQLNVLLPFYVLIQVDIKVDPLFTVVWEKAGFVVCGVD